jgi:hypothetical protein
VRPPRGHGGPGSSLARSCIAAGFISASILSHSGRRFGTVPHAAQRHLADIRRDPGGGVSRQMVEGVMETLASSGSI